MRMQIRGYTPYRLSWGLIAQLQHRRMGSPQKVSQPPKNTSRRLKSIEG